MIRSVLLLGIGSLRFGVVVVAGGLGGSHGERWMSAGDQQRCDKVGWSSTAVRIKKRRKQTEPDCMLQGILVEVCGHVRLNG